MRGEGVAKPLQLLFANTRINISRGARLFPLGQWRGTTRHLRASTHLFRCQQGTVAVLPLVQCAANDSAALRKRLIFVFGNKLRQLAN